MIILISEMDTIDLFENSVNDGEEFEEELTAAEVLQKMEDSWLNEKHSPELLESKMEIVECMMEQVNTMEENLSRLKKGDMRIPVHRFSWHVFIAKLHDLYLLGWSFKGSNSW